MRSGVACNGGVPAREHAAVDRDRFPGACPAHGLYPVGGRGPRLVAESCAPGAPDGRQPNPRSRLRAAPMVGRKGGAMMEELGRLTESQRANAAARVPSSRSRRAGCLNTRPSCAACSFCCASTGWATPYPLPTGTPPRSCWSAEGGRRTWVSRWTASYPIPPPPSGGW